MSVLVIGNKGNMGRRYCAILSHLRREFVGVDKETTRDEILSYAKKSTHVIIATPTKTHLDIIESLNTSGVPLLCEKPLSTNLPSLEVLLHECRRYKTSLSMIYQYGFMPNATDAKEGVTLYDYYKHGEDGMVWDCIQIIGLAKGSIILKEKSPIWTCNINGTPMDIGKMDLAYVKFIASWLKQPGHSLDKLYSLHAKAAEQEIKYKNELQYH